ncbi:hypothetical protein BDR26DRAFT_139993 [Obelidium mucronatum]|nr:hypothetical protein BDR26DRAFT_139993 [Obelidium mucronatum]
MSSVSGPSSATSRARRGLQIKTGELLVKVDLSEGGEKAQSRQWGKRSVAVEDFALKIYTRAASIPLKTLALAAARAERVTQYKQRQDPHIYFRVNFPDESSFLFQTPSALDTVIWIESINNIARSASEYAVSEKPKDLLSLRLQMSNKAGGLATTSSEMTQISMYDQEWIANLSTRAEELEEEIRISRLFLTNLEASPDFTPSFRNHSRTWSEDSDVSNAFSRKSERQDSVSSVRSLYPSTEAHIRRQCGSSRLPSGGTNPTPRSSMPLRNFSPQQISSKPISTNASDLLPHGSKQSSPEDNLPEKIECESHTEKDGGHGLVITSSNENNLLVQIQNAKLKPFIKEAVCHKNDSFNETAKVCSSPVIPKPPPCEPPTRFNSASFSSQIRNVRLKSTVVCQTSSIASASVEQFGSEELSNDQPKEKSVIAVPDNATTATSSSSTGIDRDLTLQELISRVVLKPALDRRNSEK